MTASRPPATSFRTAFAAFGRIDLRTIRRDSLLIAVMLGPIGYALALWFLPALTAHASHPQDRVQMHTRLHVQIASSAGILGRRQIE
jgi:hypothetical protein